MMSAIVGAVPPSPAMVSAGLSRTNFATASASGRARAEYLEEEHPLEYERLKEEGKLEALQVPAPSRAAYLWSLSLGGIAIVTGLVLTGLVIYAVVG